jgi:hypothetical protein
MYVGRERYELGGMETGSKVRMMLCVATRKFRVYVNGEKRITCDFPPTLHGTVYFYAELLGTGCVKILR